MDKSDIIKDLLILWNKCEIKENKLSEIDSNINQIIKGKEIYQKVSDIIGCPWYLIGIIHGLEGGYDFNSHLHNGDSLKKRTVHVPKNRPPFGSGPYHWDVSAIDALQMKSWDKIEEWSVEEILYQMERFNGFGYRNYHPTVKSPYLWSYTNNYSKGKYVADGKWSSSAVSKQAGGCSILKRMYDRNLIDNGKDNIQYFIIQGSDNCIYFSVLNENMQIIGKENLGNSLEEIVKNSQNLFNHLKSKYNKIEIPSNFKCHEPIDFSRIEIWNSGIDKSNFSIIQEFRRGENVQLTKNFHLSEMECKCGKCQITIVNMNHMKKLQEMRDYFGKPIYINSGYRCPSHNIAEGGASDSEHLKGATDITVRGIKPSEMVRKALEMNFGGVGSYKTFTHLDSRTDEVARW